MSKRSLAGILWFLAGWEGGGLFVGIFGLPSVLAFAPGIVLAVLVLWDPTGLFWSRSKAQRRVVEINAYAEELDKRVEPRPVAEQDSQRV